MDEVSFEEMKEALEFNSSDEANVHALAASARPLTEMIVGRFYERLLQHAGARAVFSGGKEQIARQVVMLTEWLVELFTGPYDADYYEKRRRIGAAHVRVSLPQHYMFTGIALIGEELEQRLSKMDIPGLSSKLESLRKLLMLDLAVMLESYKDAHSEHARKAERSVVEEKLTRAEHLAEIGQLAASLAHEIKNPLAGISGAIQIIRDGMPPGDPHQPIVGEILGQIGRLDATVKDLLQYARPTPPQAAHTPLGDVIDRILNLLRAEPALQRVRIECDKGSADCSVYADEMQIEQLLINLIINAAHASEDGGLVNLSVSETDERVTIVVRDEGRGMDSQTRARAFEAFFTTKAKGTGLGLSICKRIVEAHGGEIELESEVGRGTSVIVHIPCKNSKATKKATKKVTT